MSGICDTCKREHCYAKTFGLKSCSFYHGGETRWEQLFGTPERAARTLAKACGECSEAFPCCECPLDPIIGSNVYEPEILEWLRGDGKLASEPPYDELLRCLENDWNIRASWDGLRKFWCIELTDEGVRMRDAELGSEINGDTSDGYHTFNELYHHRAVLFSVIVRDHRELAWKARKHHDGTMYDGMFIVGIETPKGQATYHYDLDPYWEMFDCEEREFAPEWDGHTPDEAIARIAELGSKPPRTVYIVESYDSLTEGGYVEPTCYTSKEAAIRRAESQTYDDGDGMHYWARWKELKVMEQ